MSEIRVVAAAIVHRGTVLAARRSATMPLPGKWELPGGKVEPGEDDRQALIREIEEELHVTVVPGELVGESVWDVGNRRIRLVAYTCETDGDPHPVEHDAIRWVRASELDGLDWADADRPLVAALRARLG